MSSNRLTLPNVITIVRIAACPLVFYLAVAPSLNSRLAAFVLFVAAALSDVWDGYLARRYDLVTDLGKLLDPVADKLLLASTFIPFYLISRRGVDLELIPWWGVMPVWVLVVIFGREIFITLFRSFAAGRGIVIPAGKSGKLKALLQSLFMGGLLLWYPLRMMQEENGWSGSIWTVWSVIHRNFVGLTLGLALFLTVYSMLDYLWSYRTVVGVRS